MIERHQKLPSFSKQLYVSGKGARPSFGDFLSPLFGPASSADAGIPARFSSPLVGADYASNPPVSVFSIFKTKKLLSFSKQLFCFGQGGFEPPTSTSRTWRATNCAIARNGLNIKKPTPESRFYRDVRDSNPWSPA